MHEITFRALQNLPYEFFDLIFTGIIMDESSDHYLSASFGKKLYRRIYTPRNSSREELRGGVLMVHGLGDHMGRHEKAASMFCDQGLIAAGLDWPGHGHSPGKRGHSDGVEPLLDLITESLADLRERLPTGSPIGLYAHSIGAFVLLQFLSEQALMKADVINHPSSFSFVWLSSPMLYPVHRQGVVKINISKWLSKIAPTFCLDTGSRPSRCYPPNSDTGLFKEDPLGHHNISLALAADILKRNRSVDDGAHVFQQPMRLLITQGGDDTICPPDYSQIFFDAVSLPTEDKTYLLLPGVLHEPLSGPEAFELLTTVAVWVDETLNARPKVE